MGDDKGPPCARLPIAATATLPFDPPISPRFSPLMVFNSSPVLLLCLKKNQNAPRPSEYPSVRGENMSKRLGGIKCCKYKTSSWHLNGFPDGNNIGLTV